MINNIKVLDKNWNMVDIEINKDLSKCSKMDILQLSRQLIRKYNNMYSYSIYSELLNILGL
jgi:hypothetical protein